MRIGAAALSTMLLLACDATGPSEPLNALFLPAGVTVVQVWRDMFETSPEIHLEVENSTASAAQVGYGVCTFLVQGHERPNRSGDHKWSHLLPQLGGCGPDILYTITVPPHSLVSQVIGTIPAELRSKAGAMTLLYRVPGQSGTTKLPVHEAIID